MDFRNTIDALQTNASEIDRLLDHLKKPEGFRRVEIDLILDKLRSMYDLMLDLQDTVKVQSVKEGICDEEPAIPVEKQKIVNVQEQKIVPEEKKAGEVEKMTDIEFTTDETREKSIEKKLEERKKAARAQIEQDLKKEKEEQQEAAAKKAVISDRFKTNKPTLAEELGSKKKFDDLASHLKTGISGTFGLNEKFEIINELFDGDKDKFEYALQVVGMAGSFVEAYNYLKENFNWDMDKPHVQRLLEQIRRKLIVHRTDE